MYGLSEIRRANQLADAKARKQKLEEARASAARPGGDDSSVEQEIAEENQRAVTTVN